VTTIAVLSSGAAQLSSVRANDWQIGKQAGTYAKIPTLQA